MQRYCTELTERLLKSLDKEYNVVDMGAVVDVITALEKTTITKEVLEITRLGKYINELRRKTNNDALAKRAKDLVRRWRDMVLPSAHTQPQPTPADTAPQALNGTKPQSPALRGLKPQSPATFRSLKPQSPALKAPLKQPHSPLMRDATPLKVLSPALSLHSDQSRSPNFPSSKHHQQPALAQTAPTTANNRLLQNSTISPKLGPISAHNHTIEAVPRTHSSNKRLRKDETTLTSNSPLTPPPPSGGVSLVKTTSSLLSSQDSVLARLEPSSKRQRLNGENQPNFPITDTTTATTTTTTTTSPKTLINNIISRGLTNSLTINQQVPSRTETEKTNDRIPEVPNSLESSLSTVGVDSILVAPAGPKKRGRKKGSKSIKNQALPEDRVKEKLASISRNPKLKTTQELLADLQARGSSASSHFGTATPTVAPSRSTEPPSTEEILRNAANDERSLSSRFLRLKREKSSNFSADGTKKHRGKSNAVGVGKRWENSRKSDNEDDDDDDDDSEIHHQDSVDNGRTKELSVEEILAKLPPLDRDAISWSDSDEKEDEIRCEGRERREICDDDVERLHSKCIEGLNGNFQEIIVDSRDGKITTTTATTTTTTLDEKQTSANVVRIEDIRIEDSIDDAKSKSVYRRLGEKENDREFREWHEMLARPSYDGQILHILPYVIID